MNGGGKRMINPAKIKYNEPKYYAPSYGSAIKVSIIKLKGTERMGKI